jgi:G protein-coupled receptor GPR1
MWIIPFALHLLNFQDRYTVDPPFGLTCASTVFICSQAAVDCWFFSTREKPWKHFHRSDGTFWGSLKFWSGWQGVRRKRSKFHGPGKTREVMTREARAAYQRREVELAEWRLEAVQRAQNREHRTKRNWWETVDVDGEINVIQEKSAIPPCGDDDDNDVYSSYSSDGEQDSARNTPESLGESN